MQRAGINSERRQRRLDFLPSPIPGFFIGLDSQSIDQLIKAAEEVNYRHQFEKSRIVQPKLPRRGSMYGKSVIATVHG